MHKKNKLIVSSLLCMSMCYGMNKGPQDEQKGKQKIEVTGSQPITILSQSPTHAKENKQKISINDLFGCSPVEGQERWSPSNYFLYGTLAGTPPSPNCNAYSK